ncbi:MAG: hypothetical protein GXY76_21930 [Chloroflexi bacterium]|nr:hypothetical protein [Chloroflexota bacterium]
MSAPVRLGLAVAASPLEVGAGDAPRLLAELRDALAALGGLECCLAPGPLSDPNAAVAAGRFFYDQRVDALCVVAASWFEDYLVLDLLEECPAPLILWARPGMQTGALCGTQQLGLMLKALGQPFCFLFEPVGAEAGAARAGDFARAAALRRHLRRARIGYLGHRVEGMTETTAHELALKRLWGPRVVGLDSQLFLQRAANVEAEALRGDWEALKGRVGRVTSADESGLESLRVHAALRQVVAERGLSAVAVGCYPHLMGKVCLAASLLAEEGVPVACEGDVNGAVAMLALTRLTGQPVHNTDLLDPLPEENAIVFSHCGSGAFSLAADAADIHLAPVRLMDRGLCCLFPGRPGPITLLNLAPTLDGYRLGLLHGEVMPTEMVFPGNPLRVRFQAGYRDILAWIIDEGLGHHWMAAYGDWRRPLADLAGMVGVPLSSMA